MTDAFLDSLDIANRALDHLGLPHILAVDEDSTRNSTIAGVYDKLREAELRRNVWKFAKRRTYVRAITATSRLLRPRAWVENETYLPGAIVADANGALWISWEADNYQNEPGVSDKWDAYYGPMAIDAWSASTSYAAGEVVYKAATYDGSFAVFLSTSPSNSDDPDDTTAWAIGTTYGLNDRVYFGGAMWRSLISLNTGISPVEPPADWSEGVTYDTATKVTASDGFVYTCTTDDTTDVDPISDDGTFWTRGVAAAWTAAPGQYTSSPKWLPIFADMVNVPGDWLYSAGGNGSSVYRIPSGFLRRSRLFSSQRQAADGTEPIGNYITGTGNVLLLEFVANVRDVRLMDPMFCEGLALRIAFGTCEKLTQSSGKLQNLVSEYTKFMSEARTVNGIELPPEEADEDEYLLVQRQGAGAYGGFSNAGTKWW